MQLLLSSVIATSLFILSQKNFVAAEDEVIVKERMVRFLFNNGNTPSSSQTCTSQDNAKIDEIFKYRYSRRYLRSAENMVNETAARNYYLTNETTFTNPPDFLVNGTVSRELQTYPRYCQNNCAGYKAGCCRATNCIGYRRELKNEKFEHRDRDLQVADCSTVLTAIQNKLNNLVWNNQVSSSCKNYINAPIIKTCTDDVVYGVLEGVKVWEVSNPSSPTLLGSFDANSIPLSKNGMPASRISFCRSKKITIEAVMNPCVLITSFWMYYQSDWYSPPVHVNNEQKSLPFSLYGNSNGQMNGKQWLKAGWYSLDIKPDWWNWKEKRFVFTVNDC
jgi:hypothetical protein